MNATIFFIGLSDAQREEVNLAGWDSSHAARAYLDAAHGHRHEQQHAGAMKAAELGLYQPVAIGDYASDEDAWCRLQNITASWTEAEAARGVVVMGERHRSMMVGDVIVWADSGEAWICASFGWSMLTKERGERFVELMREQHEGMPAPEVAA